MKKRKEKILICGASIAGPCLANLLNRSGFKTIIIEKASELRDGGHNVDIHGAGRKIVERMGLLERIRSHHTSERGMRIVDDEGKVLAEFPQNPESDSALTKELEILRGDLAKVFYDTTKDQTEYRFGISLRKLSDTENSVFVEFSDGSSEEFDLVISAEGAGSATRKLVMEEYVKTEYLGMWMGFFRIPKISTDDDWAETNWRAGGPGLVIRPATKTSRGVLLSYKSDNAEFDYRPQSDQKETIRAVLNDAGWQSERVCQNLDYDRDLYLGPLAQIKADRWSKGRFVLVGDAGYSPSVMTGRGTTLAITGAYILAGELSRNDKVLPALASYESILRPFAEACQKLRLGLSKFLDFSADGEPDQMMMDLVMKEDFFELPNYEF